MLSLFSPFAKKHQIINSAIYAIKLQQKIVQIKLCKTNSAKEKIVKSWEIFKCVLKSCAFYSEIHLSLLLYLLKALVTVPVNLILMLTYIVIIVCVALQVRSVKFRKVSTSERFSF